ncbi:MAG: DUF4097 family beta strand repeat-containing protein [Terriglobales bacterium]
MASNYGVQPAPDPNQPPRRSYAGPIVLITLGVLFLLGNLHVITWRNLGAYFARYWPVLIILWGVIKLFEYYMAQREGRRAASIGVGGVFLLVFLIVAGLIASGVQRVNWAAVGNKVNIDDAGPFSELFGQTYSFNQELQQPFAAGSTLRVISDRGGVNVEPWDQDTIKVTVAKRLRAQGEDEANKADAATRATLTVNGNEITLNANTRGSGERFVVSDLTVYLPKKAAVDIATRRGDVSVRQRIGDVEVTNAHADVRVDDVAGNVKITNRGDVHISKVTGNVILEGRMNNVGITEVTGSVRVNADVMDSITVSKVTNQVSYRSSRTDLELARLPGDLTLRSGELNGKDIAGPVRISTRSKEIHLSDVAGEVRIQNSNGVVEIHATKLPLGPMQVSNRRGDIRLMLPAKASFQLDARTVRGDITSDFNLNVQNERGRSQASGTVGTGGPRLELENEGGDVEVRKAT